MSYLAKTPDGLLTCPHCGGEAEARDGSSTRPYIRCNKCGCRTGSSCDMDKLKEAWNCRAERTCMIVPRDGDVSNGLSCSECGTELYGEWAFCPSCGARVIEEGR